MGMTDSFPFTIPCFLETLKDCNSLAFQWHIQNLYSLLCCTEYICYEFFFLHLNRYPNIQCLFTLRLAFGNNHLSGPVRALRRLSWVYLALPIGWSSNCKAVTLSSLRGNTVRRPRNTVWGCIPSASFASFPGCTANLHFQSARHFTASPLPNPGVFSL